MVDNPQESLENAANTMGTLLGVHPIVPWLYGDCNKPQEYKHPYKPISIMEWL